MCYTPDVINAIFVMRNFQILIVLCTVFLVGYITWDTIARLDAIANLTCTNEDKYDRYFFGENTPCDLSGDNPSGRKSLNEIFGTGFTKEEVIKFKKELSDSALRRGMFLDAVIFLTGTFTFVTVGKLQSEKGGSDEAKGKNKDKT